MQVEINPRGRAPHALSWSMAGSPQESAKGDTEHSAFSGLFFYT